MTDPNPAPGCLDADAIARVCSGASVTPEIEAHLDQCESCFALVAAALAADEVGHESTEPPTADQPVRVGRYEIDGVLGEGGMGRVLLARDPTLERDVALKLVRDEVFDASGREAARARLRREALAMAKVSHPHVVHVYEVGEHEGQVFIAMERVRGEPLDAWIARQHPDVSTIVGLFVDAAHGLAAAHAVDIVHRDVKPANLLVDDRGHVRVSDFGLAFSQAVASSDGEDAAPASRQTAHGKLPGTKLYMAPERFGGAEADARADQYSLCVALYEALTRRLPVLPEAIASGPPWPRPSMSGIPRRLRPVLTRSLDPDPDARFDSLETLAGALASVQRRPTAWILAGLGIAAIAGVSWAQTGSNAACPDSWRELEATWNAERSQNLGEHFADTAPSYGSDLAQVVVGELDRHAEQWSSMRSEVCRAAKRRSEQATLPLRRTCLDARLSALDALVDELETASPAELARAPAAVARWTVADCGDEQRLLVSMPPPDAELAIEAERKALERASVQLALGRELVAIEALRDAQPRVERLDHAPLSAEWAVLQGSALAATGQVDAAQASLHRALVEALAGRHEAVQASAYLELASLLITRSGQRKRAGEYLELADTLLARQQPTTDHRRAKLLWADYHQGMGQLEEALALTSEVLADSAPVATDERLAALNRRVAILGDLGRRTEAVDDARQAVTVAASLGHNHPSVAAAKGELSMLLAVVGELDDALVEAQRALEIRQAHVGGDPALLARAHNDVGAVAWRMGRMPEARVSFEAALTLMDPESTAYGVTADNLGNVLMHLGEVASAEALHRDAIRSLRAAHGEAHYETALAHHNLAETLYRQERFEPARTEYERALAVNEIARGEEHPDNAAMLLGMGKCSMKLGQYEDAEKTLARALDLRDGEGDDAFTRGVIRYALAVAVERGSGDVARARQLVQAAVDDFGASQVPAKGDLERAERWLREHLEETQP